VRLTVKCLLNVFKQNEPRLKLTIDIEISDFEINASTVKVEKGDAYTTALKELAYLLSRAQRSVIAQPLYSTICEEFNLEASPDYPVAAISATADHLAVGNAYWFRAAPVHLTLQRDAFSLDEEVPLNVNVEHAQALLETLNQHFKEDGLQFLLGVSGAWYLKVTGLLEHYLPVKTHFPQMAVGKNIHVWMPQGQAAQKWRSILNELQMVLFEHSVNQARESVGALAVNSVWISGGGFMPSPSTQQLKDLMFLSNNPFYAGLAQYLHAKSSALPDNFAELTQKNSSNMRMYLPVEKTQNVISALIKGLKEKKISSLTVNIGFYDQTLVANIKPHDLYKFWIKTKTLSHYFIS